MDTENVINATYLSCNFCSILYKLRNVSIYCMKMNKNDKMASLKIRE